jgi:hypothetical protein
MGDEAEVLSADGAVWADEDISAQCSAPVLRFNYSGVTPSVYHSVIYGNTLETLYALLPAPFGFSTAGSGRYSLVLTDDVDGDRSLAPTPSRCATLACESTIYSI